MKKMSTINKLTFLINIFLLIEIFVLGYMQTPGMDVIMSAVALLPLYILMNFFTIYQLGDKWLIAFNVGNCIGIFIYTILLMAASSGGGGLSLFAFGATDLLFLTGFNVFFVVFDICKFISSKIKRNDRVEEKKSNQQTQLQEIQPQVVTTLKQVMRPVQTNIEPNTQCVDNQKEEVNQQNNNIEVNNVTINLNNLTPEQKDQLLVILAQNNNN